MMILSGILMFQETTLRTALDTAHLAVVDQLVEDNWVALAVKHQERRPVRLTRRNETDREAPYSVVRAPSDQWRCHICPSRITLCGACAAVWESGMKLCIRRPWWRVAFAARTVDSGAGTGRSRRDCRRCQFAQLPLMLGQALPNKSSKMDLIVEKGSELGLTTFTPSVYGSNRGPRCAWAHEAPSYRVGIALPRRRLGSAGDAIFARYR